MRKNLRQQHMAAAHDLMTRKSVLSVKDRVAYAGVHCNHQHEVVSTAIALKCLSTSCL